VTWAYCCIRKFLMRCCAFSRPALTAFAGLTHGAVALRWPHHMTGGLRRVPVMEAAVSRCGCAEQRRRSARRARELRATRR
jgi:hypothetical protein